MPRADTVTACAIPHSRSRRGPSAWKRGSARFMSYPTPLGPTPRQSKLASKSSGGATSNLSLDLPGAAVKAAKPLPAKGGLVDQLGMTMGERGHRQAFATSR